MILDLVPADDRGLMLGDGLFETVLAEDGVLARFDRHLERMIRGCAVIGIEPPDAATARTAAEAALKAAQALTGRAAVRLTLTAGSGRGLDRDIPAKGRLLATASAAPRAQGPISLAMVDIRRNETSLAARLKTLSYLDNVLARRQARASGAEEALMLNGRGEIACAAAANVFWVREGRLYTPQLDCGVLEGIMRGQAIEAARALGVQVVETAASSQALAGADGVFLTNSLIGVRAAHRLDGRAVPLSPLTEALRRRL
jgi:branched-chain amino acid aminotransferase/4-amino-4-deoxychorismate lyase